jgi:hypothetical protein
MKTRALALPSVFEEEFSLCRYLMSPHEGHAYAEDVIDAISLITCWTLVALAGLAALTVLASGVLS